MPDVEDQVNVHCSRAIRLLAAVWVGLAVAGVVAYGIVHGRQG